jgi:hypothetical protein
MGWVPVRVGAEIRVFIGLAFLALVSKLAASIAV